MTCSTCGKNLKIRPVIGGVAMPFHLHCKKPGSKRLPKSNNFLFGIAKRRKPEILTSYKLARLANQW